MLRQLGEAFGEEGETICRPLNILSNVLGHILFLKTRKQISDRRHKVGRALYLARRV